MRRGCEGAFESKQRVSAGDTVGRLVSLTASAFALRGRRARSGGAIWPLHGRYMAVTWTRSKRGAGAGERASHLPLPYRLRGAAEKTRRQDGAGPKRPNRVCSSRMCVSITCPANAIESDVLVHNGEMGQLLRNT